ncbi:hypothetical protein A3Q56_06465 [Intoshia linei]|uniref:Apyrase n=1 Tax=Intoshia linei TaxID=1819745 RepID=A0A177AV07_9BILA|nr:hypothetical protein A3Q56_06465 [Intoshia linei]
MRHCFENCDPCTKIQFGKLCSENVDEYTESLEHLRFVMITDNDKRSKEVDKDGKFIWISHLQYATLTVNPYQWSENLSISIYKNTTRLSSYLNYKGRGMELSDILTFNNDLITFDDKTGIIYKIKDFESVVPLYILTTEDEMQRNISKCAICKKCVSVTFSKQSFKAEWATVKDNVLYVGSVGREYTNDDGSIRNRNNRLMQILEKSLLDLLENHLRSTGWAFLLYGIDILKWIKQIDGLNIINVDWKVNYDIIRNKTNNNFPGYIVHEAVEWDHINNQWCFLPRQASKHKFHPQNDYESGTNLFICGSYDNYKIVEISNLEKETGFSAFSFVPYTENKLIIAIRTFETKFEAKSTLWLFSIYGDVYMKNVEIGPHKYEGIEFI